MNHCITKRSYRESRAILVSVVLFVALCVAQPLSGVDTSSTPTGTVNPKPLAQIPRPEKGTPGAGRRVAVTEPEYVGTDVHHILYLPTNYGAKKRYPLIVEYTGNYVPDGSSTGLIEDAHLGFALTLGKDFIWVVLPYIALDHQHNERTWWGDTQATVDYAERAIPRIIKQYHGDRNAVILCGFSRGAIGVSYIGLHNDKVAKLWSAFYTHDHFDGVLEWKGQSWGSPLQKYREEAAQRLHRVHGRPFWVGQMGSTNDTKNYLSEWSLLSNGNFTFEDIPMKQLFPVVPNEYFMKYHNDMWPIFDTPSGRDARQWLRTVSRLPAVTPQ